MNQEFVKFTKLYLMHKPAIQNNDLHGHVTHGSLLIYPCLFNMANCYTELAHLCNNFKQGIGPGVLQTCAVKPY